MSNASVEIKNTIGLLCKILNVVYSSNLKPEHFRLAKFNKTEDNVASTFMTALTKIVNKQTPKELQEHMHTLNYKRKQFYNVNLENCTESRELLLALAYLVLTMLQADLLQKLDSVAECPNVSQPVLEEPELSMSNLKGQDLKNYKLWLSGKIISNKNMKSEYDEIIKKLQNKFNKLLNIKAHSSLTLYEILALKNAEIKDQYIQDTEYIVSIMHVYTEWAKKEKIFWKWMGTVLEEVKKSC
ncbi:uncharacterized protein LOC126743209 isoform X2 [Anthonomus grandis grandis]|uniref:uncharacterized protein LOC126743209 isoform X2 n=1 Tax=Anthonomus grandis grandis TaxID=2921223 RepID=UPI0021663C08|nr:uncharacterized protein LOC126743209 isoform X2 [Anthonomus grandis grandis]